MIQTRAHRGQHGLNLVAGGMRQGDQQALLTGMLGQAGDAGEQQRSTGNGLAPGLWMRKAHIPAPPVVNQGHRPCGQRSAPRRSEMPEGQPHENSAGFDHPALEAISLAQSQTLERQGLQAKQGAASFKNSNWSSSREAS